MAYRFILEVPEMVQEDAKIAVESSRDAEILIERHPHELDPNDAFAELTIVAHSLDVVDNLYNWAISGDFRSNVYLYAHKGQRVSLGDHDSKSMRRLIQGDQYWFENTTPRISHQIDLVMEGGSRVADVPYGGRLANSTSALQATSTIDIGSVDNIAINVRDIARAEEFYRDFFGMNVIYRARRDDDRWEHLNTNYSYNEGIHTGIEPEIVRLENGSVGLVLINTGMGKVLHEPRLAYISLNVPMDTLNHLRGRALFSSFTVQEDSPRAFRFVDPFSIVWQIVAS
ncbi:MAG: VOC family protein [Chloroflexia bacterium]|jgi:catechol 2,3-dioxygenase-like lactoylglutathione lyase family enzyme|nr:VOC family protein [Chloroflexia bacterium]